MKKKLLSFLALFISLSIYFSCTDEGVEVSGLQRINPDSDLLAYAMNLVGENGEGCSLIDLQKGSTNSRAVTDYSTVATPLWDKAKKEQYGDEEVLIVPLQSENDIHSSMYFEEEEMGRLYQTKTFSKLVVRNKNGHTVTQVFTYLPGRNYAKNRQAVLDTMGFSPLAIKYYGTILISDLTGKFQQGFYYERGIPTIHLTPKKHTHTAGSRAINDSTECDNHEHSHSMDIRLKLSGNMRITSRSSDDGDETYEEFSCPVCGSIDPTHSCFTVEGNYVYCDDCGKLKGQCVCLPSMTACGVCGMYYCICFEPCEECGSYPCVCDELIGGGNNSGGDNLGGGGSGGGSNPGNNSDTGGGDGSEPLSCKNLEEVLEYIPPRLMLMGIDLAGISIVENDNCDNFAEIDHSNKSIKICPREFYKFLITDQTAIIYHEYYHLTYDNPKRTDWRTYNKDLPEILYMVPTDEIMKYYTEKWNEVYKSHFEYRYKEFGKDFNDYLKDYFLQVTAICHPSYYLNEINAYEAEIRMFPNLTGQYNEDRLFKLWEHRQKYDISIEYYGKI